MAGEGCQGRGGADKMEEDRERARQGRGSMCGEEGQVLKCSCFVAAVGISGP